MAVSFLYNLSTISQVNLARNIDIGFCSFSKNLKNNNSKGFNFGHIQSLAWPSKSAFGFTLRASATSQSVVSEKSSEITRTKPTDDIKLYVGLPLDTVSNSNTINHARAIAAGLKALKLLGVTGIELPVWWGIAENEARGKYRWSSYLTIVEMIEKLDLKLHVSLCFHASEECKVSLPHWVSKIGEEEPSIYYKGQSGQHYKSCLSLGVDDVRVLGGETPVEVYREFCESFKCVFAPFFGSTITGVSVGLGPDGELRYPSHHRAPKGNTHRGAGEFQCYDKNMLDSLKQHAKEHGDPLWGLGGPHDAPGYEQCPISNGGFFSETDGSWNTPYGEFFLSWYSSQLISHGNRILSLAASTFRDTPVAVSGKIPMLPSWYKTQSHPSELAAGIYNTAHRDGYDRIAEIFSKNACKMIVPGMDQLDDDQSRSSPESLLAQVKSSCRKHAVEVYGQNTSVEGVSSNFEQIKKNLLDENAAVDLFVYQRMGAYFFSPEHFPSFAWFVRGVNESGRSLDDLPVEEVDIAGPRLGTNSLHMQTA